MQLALPCYTSYLILPRSRPLQDLRIYPLLFSRRGITDEVGELGGGGAFRAEQRA